MPLNTSSFSFSFSLIVYVITLPCSTGVGGWSSVSNRHAAFKLIFNLSYLVKLWKAAALCLLVMQSSNLSYLVKLCKAAARGLLVMQPSNLDSLSLSPSFYPWWLLLQIGKRHWRSREVSAHILEVSPLCALVIVDLSVWEICQKEVEYVWPSACSLNLLTKRFARVNLES